MGFFSTLKRDIRRLFGEQDVEEDSAESGDVVGYSTPISDVCISKSGKFYDKDTHKNISIEKVREKAINDGFVPVYTTKSIWYKLFFVVFFSWTFIPNVICLVKAFQKFFPNFVLFKRPGDEQGMKLPLTKKDQARLRVEGLVYFLLGTLPILLIALGVARDNKRNGGEKTESDSIMVFSRLELDTVFSSDGVPQEIRGKEYTDVQLSLAKDTVFLTVPYRCFMPSIYLNFFTESVYNKQTSEFEESHFYTFDTYQETDTCSTYFIPRASLPETKYNSSSYHSSIFDVEIYYVPTSTPKEELEYFTSDPKLQVSHASSYHVQHVNVKHVAELDEKHKIRIENYLSPGK